ncbi:MAG: type II toxin-antitoxin system RelB/DinJ family antitoxin [Oscillospiraceae bacterium]|jgi:addiction module RelB/DinJ family antitoxin|nr:type II toxin-antitoxin system RelB/DinJ family antitoxin [Oscillospiraceae bacterium]
MGQTTLNVRMDEDLKRRFDSFCAEVGMNASVAVNLFVKAVIREQRIPFEITTAPNQDTRAAIEETEKDLTSRKLKSYANVDEMMKELLS